MHSTHAAKISSSVRKHYEDPQARAVASTAAKKRYEDPAERRKTAEAVKLAAKRPEVLAKYQANAAKARDAASKLPKRAMGLSGSAEYRIWSAMVARCTNPKSSSYANYGGRGITVHPSWCGPRGFAVFYRHVGPRPSTAHSIDRIDNNGNYAPGNVRWSTRQEQSHNSRRIRWVKINGESLPLAEWARRIGVSPPTLAYRLKQGWSGEKLMRPGRKR